MVVIYLGLIALTGYQFIQAPTGFIPQQDQGYLITIIQLPPGASLARTDEVARKVTKIVLATPGIAHAVPIVGLDGATFTNAPNAGVVFTPLDDFKQRAEQGPKCASADRRRCNQQFAVDPGSLRHQRGAAAGARHRHHRWLQDGGAGRSWWRAGRARKRCHGHHGASQPDARARRRVHHLQHQDAEGLRRYRPRARRDAGRQHQRRVRDARGVSRLAIRQRLQLSRPHLPRHGAGRRQFPPGPARHRQSEDAQRKGRHGAALLGRLVPQHHRTLPGRAFQPVPISRRARRYAAWLLDRLWARRHGEDREG